jgi:hypothetical protein
MKGISVIVSAAAFDVVVVVIVDFTACHQLAQEVLKKAKMHIRNRG